jgi:hypothetical protein
MEPMANAMFTGSSKATYSRQTSSSFSMNGVVRGSWSDRNSLFVAFGSERTTWRCRRSGAASPVRWQDVFHV